MLCPVLEDRRDASGEGARDDPDDGEWFSNDLKPSRMVALDGQRKGLFLSPDMLVALLKGPRVHFRLCYQLSRVQKRLN